eukprot:TRINITY_DN12133_c0_g1_i1.p1 TRINITY_DN12133_c0_g1~~TRINITY_DN12133_c0_g1_i1.p1  ORF type:complete len:136 (+),score=4.02 TRINITY_DN12133_c0_g1_i1:233-640(+)
MWDTAGQERYSALAPMYYRGSRGVLLFFDLANRESLIRANMWLKDMANKVPANSRTILIGTKADLADRRTVSYEEAKEFAKQTGIPFIETSSRLNINIEEAMKLLVNEIENAGSLEDPYYDVPPPVASRSWCTIL